MTESDAAVLNPTLRSVPLPGTDAEVTGADDPMLRSTDQNGVPLCSIR